MKKYLLSGLALFVAAGLALAQVPGLFIASPTGLEQIEVRVPSTGAVVTSPQKTEVTINQIRNSTGYVAVAAGTTVTTNMANTVAVALATGAITTWNLNLPPAPENGQNAIIGCPGGDVTTLTIAVVSPTVIVGVNPTSCTEATPTSARFIYSLSANTWYRVS